MSDYFLEKRKLWASEKSVNKRTYERISNKCNGPIYFFIKDQASKRHAKEADYLHLFWTLLHQATLPRWAWQSKQHM